jgi:hypothetical protein
MVEKALVFLCWIGQTKRFCAKKNANMLAAAPTPLIMGGSKTVIVSAMRHKIARLSERRHQASGMWSFAR